MLQVVAMRHGVLAAALTALVSTSGCTDRGDTGGAMSGAPQAMAGESRMAMAPDSSVVVGGQPMLPGRTIVDNADVKCRAILTEHIDDLHTLAKALLEYETLTGEEIKALLRGEQIVREKDDNIVPPAGVRSSVPSTGGPIGTGPQPEPQGG